MIDRDEIDAMRVKLGVQAPDVQRDYLYGWLLAGIYSESRFADTLVLKGGNAFRKGYFVATRFSGDLDFASPNKIDPEEFKNALNDACRMIEARTGVRFDLDRSKIAGQHAIDNTKTVYKFTLYFTDFYNTAKNMTITLRMDVTEFGRLYLPPQRRNLIHPYSDHTDCATTLTVVSLEEALADKLKCLLQRRSSFDLFDLVYSIFLNDAVAVDKAAVISTFLRKTIFGPDPAAALGLLLAVPFDIMRPYWETKIICAKESLLDFGVAVTNLKDELASLFSPFRPASRGQLAFYPAELRTPILEAGQTRTLLRVTYNGRQRLVEPYELAFKRRKDGVGQEYLYVWDQTGGNSGPGIKALLNGGITKLEQTDIRFEPRYEIELAKAGEHGDRTAFGGSRRRTAFSASRPTRTYRVRCAGCHRVFTRSTPSTSMRPHQNGYGNPCPSRRGHRV